jgi:hypothetical protein
MPADALMIDGLSGTDCFRDVKSDVMVGGHPRTGHVRKPRYAPAPGELGDGATNDSHVPDQVTG